MLYQARLALRVSQWMPEKPRIPRPPSYLPDAQKIPLAIFPISEQFHGQITSNNQRMTRTKMSISMFQPVFPVPQGECHLIYIPMGQMCESGKARGQRCPDAILDIGLIHPAGSNLGDSGTGVGILPGPSPSTHSITTHL